MRRKHLITVLMVIGVMTCHAGAAILSVPGDYATIQAAVNAAFSGDTIQVTDQGIYSEDVSCAGKDLTIESLPAGATIKATTVAAVVVYTGNVTIDGFVVDANSKQYGIKVENGPANATVKNSSIKKMGTDWGFGGYSGGANAILTLEKCTVSDRVNANAYLAGAGWGATLNIQQCKLIETSLYWKGVLNQGALVNLENSLLYSTKPQDWDWGVMINDATNSVTNTLNTTNINYCTFVDANYNIGGNSCISLWPASTTYMINLSIKNSILAGNSWNCVRVYAPGSYNYSEDHCLMTSRAGSVTDGYGFVGTNRLESVYPEAYTDYPSFLNKSDDFRLSYNLSPAADSADAANNIGVDLNGDVRDSLPDRGCFESNPTLVYVFSGHWLIADYIPASNIDNDGFVADWGLVNSDVQHQICEGDASAKNRQQDIQYAWDESKLYIRVAETVVDNELIEGEDNFEWASGPYQYDGVGLFNLPNAASLPNSALYLGMSSDGIERINVGAARHSVVAGKRITEAQVAWSDIAPAATIQVGYFFRSDPLILDSDLENWSYYPGGTFNWDVLYRHQSFIGGATWAIEGEANYTQVHLGMFADINKNHFVDLNDFAKIASAWLENNCGRANGFCGGADLWPLGSGDGTVDLTDLEQMASEWLE